MMAADTGEMQFEVNLDGLQENSEQWTKGLRILNQLSNYDLSGTLQLEVNLADSSDKQSEKLSQLFAEFTKQLGANIEQKIIHTYEVSFEGALY